MRLLSVFLLIFIFGQTLAAPQKRTELTSEYEDKVENIETMTRGSRRIKVTATPSYEDEILKDEEAEETTERLMVKKITTTPVSEDFKGEAEEKSPTTNTPKVFKKMKSTTTESLKIEEDEETVTTKKPKTVKKFTSDEKEEETTRKLITKATRKPKIALRKATHAPDDEEQFVKRSENEEEEVGILKLQKPEVKETPNKPKSQKKKAVEEKKEKRAEEFAVNFEEEIVNKNFNRAFELKKGMFVMVNDRPTKLNKMVMNKFDVFLEGENLFEGEKHSELVPKNQEVETLTRFLKDYKLISIKNNMANLISLDGNQVKKNIPFANENILRRAEAERKSDQDLIITMLTLSDQFKAQHNLF